jgi:hypothetical protein
MAEKIIVASEQSTQVMRPETPEAEHALQQLDFATWLPYAAKLYNINPDIRAYVLATIPICPSDIPNRNGIGFPLQELLKFQEPPIARQSYKAWSGCPLHYEHRNEIHEDAYGIILDTAMRPIKGYGKGKLWKVMGLIGVDRTKHPEMARRVMEGDINTYSMGALVDSFSCSYCGSPVTKKSSCGHVNLNRDIDWNEVRSWDNKRHIAFRNAHGIQPIETSLVESPAWTTALSDVIHTKD